MAAMRNLRLCLINVMCSDSVPEEIKYPERRIMAQYTCNTVL